MSFRAQRDFNPWMQLGEMGDGDTERWASQEKGGMFETQT